MNKFIVISVIAMIAVGCTDHRPAAYPCAEPLPNKDLSSTEIKVFVYKGTSWFWNEITQSWEWMTSEENKDRAGKVWETTKQVASDTYDKALKVYHEHVDTK